MDFNNTYLRMYEIITTGYGIGMIQVTADFDEQVRNKMLSEFDCETHFISGNSQTL